MRSGVSAPRSVALVLRVAGYSFLIRTAVP
jgi:hypothetical protein